MLRKKRVREKTVLAEKEEVNICYKRVTRCLEKRNDTLTEKKT